MITKEKNRAADEMLHMRIQAWHEERDREIQCACQNAIKKPYLQKIQQWEKWKAQGLDKNLCAQICGFPQTTYYRYKQIIANIQKGTLQPRKGRNNPSKPKWGQTEKQIVLQIRSQNPTYGKEKITVILNRDYGIKLSASTVGRILKKLFNQKLIQKSISAPKTKRPRAYPGHAQPWFFINPSNIAIGERIQIDHMTVTKNGTVYKHFQAWDRQSKFIHANIFFNAKSETAKKFLLQLIKAAPFHIKSIQVDGGSEFMGHFEQACAQLNIDLFVLPPARPKYNGGVERRNRTFREEFYRRSDLTARNITQMRGELQKALQKYNNFRPHQNLAGLTPMQYLQNAGFGSQFV